MQKKEHVVLVDSQDNQIGTAEKLTAHEQGLLHRAFSVFIFRKKDGIVQLLLQKRNSKKYHCGGLWANSCCSHPREDEAVIDAGKRRLQEEMGLAVKSLKHIGSFTYKVAFTNGLTEHEIDHVLVGFLDTDVIPFHQAEVEDAKWISVDQLKRELDTNAHLFTPWLKPALSLISVNDINL